MAKKQPKHQGYSLGISMLECVSESNKTALSGTNWKGKLVAILSRPDLLAGADNRTSLEWPKISQDTKAIALVFSILECVSELLSGTIRKGESSGDTLQARSACRSR